jgi:hypothetical protein
MMQKWYREQNALTGKIWTANVSGPPADRDFAAILDILNGTIKQLFDSMNCSNGNSLVLQDVYAHWSLDRHYPVLQPPASRNALGFIKVVQPRTYAELIDLLKTLQYSIHFKCDYYANTGALPKIVDFVPEFCYLRERVYKQMNVYKAEYPNPVSAAVFDKVYPVGDTRPNPNAYRGLGGKSDDAETIPWVKTGVSCRTAKRTAKTMTAFDYFMRVYYDAHGGGVYVPQCCISLSTNAVLSSFFLLVEPSALGESVPPRAIAKVMLSTICMMTQDGGHTIQECIAAIGMMTSLYDWFAKASGIKTAADIYRDPYAFADVKPRIDTATAAFDILAGVHFFPLEPVRLRDSRRFQLVKLLINLAKVRDPYVFSVTELNEVMQDRLYWAREAFTGRNPGRSPIPLWDSAGILDYLKRIAGW